MTNGRQLLADSKAGVNPLDGWTPEVPVGETVITISIAKHGLLQRKHALQ